MLKIKIHFVESSRLSKLAIGPIFALNPGPMLHNVVIETETATAVFFSIKPTTKALRAKMKK